MPDIFPELMGQPMSVRKDLLRTLFRRHSCLWTVSLCTEIYSTLTELIPPRKYSIQSALECSGVSGRVYMDGVESSKALLCPECTGVSRGAHTDEVNSSEALHRPECTEVPRNAHMYRVYSSKTLRRPECPGVRRSAHTDGVNSSEVLRRPECSGVSRSDQRCAYG
jgi:hypothetical protein